MSDGDKLAAIERAVRDYYFALDSREHGGAAQGKAFAAVESVMGMSWRQGEEAKRRKAGASRLPGRPEVKGPYVCAEDVDAGDWVALKEGKIIKVRVAADAHGEGTAPASSENRAD